MAHVRKELDLDHVKLMKPVGLFAFVLNLKVNAFIVEDEPPGEQQGRKRGNSIEYEGSARFPERWQNGDQQLCRLVVPHTIVVGGLHLEHIVTWVQVCIRDSPLRCLCSDPTLV